ncbi:tetratricopeptide repeat protein [Bernardetia litoralis]|uniref:tetratricopeptide repeat protein n=1 Tax=Bernardetia litoralis TaxID=999 RepID=UPI0012FDAF10|nr:tetratricopeptide repeat protein [Bernardetia litoralis]
MKYLIYIFCLLFLFSCTNKVEENEIKKEAIQLSEKALQVSQSFTNKDSLLKAITLLDKALEIEPNYSVALNNKAGFQIQVGQIDEAIDTYKRIEKIKPDNEQIKLMLGMLHYTKGDTNLANKKYNEVNQLCQKKLDKWFNDSEEEFIIKTDKAIVLKFLNREKEANELFRSVDVNKAYPDETQRELLQETIDKIIKSTPKELREQYNFKSYLAK